MIHIQMEQRSPEWYAARLGIPTASNFDKILTPTGKLSTQAEKYMHTLAAERVTGKRIEGFKNETMEAGAEMEAEARDFYELIKGSKIDPVGVIYKDERKLFSASPDGLIGEDGCLEMKCPLAHTQVGYILKDEVPTEYRTQIQGQLFVSERKWCDFLGYYPGLKPLVIRVLRDEFYIQMLSDVLERFCAELDKVVKRIS